MTNADIARKLIDAEWMKTISPMNPYILEQKIVEALDAKSIEIEALEAENERLLNWIRASRHLDGCRKKMFAYQISRKGVGCTCGKIDLTDKVSLAEAIERERGGKTPPPPIQGYA